MDPHQRKDHSIQLIRFSLITAAILVASTDISLAQDRKQLLDLRGKWKFELGDDMRRSEVRFDDSKWEQISVPSPWEDEGFPGYDGYAWYRKHFQAQPDWNGKVLYLHLGKIDDVDEVYLNGKFIGATGTFPPHYVTAYHLERQYPLVPSDLNFTGDNVIAVRVYDSQLEGGIVRGKVEIYEDLRALPMDFALPGTWKFSPGDTLMWKEVRFNDRRWKDVRVPATWETQGFPNYDGFGWYRVRFQVPPSLIDHPLILVLGKIDDIDETYVNGERIGRTGSMNTPEDLNHISDQEWQQLRTYTIPPNLLRVDRENVLAVRVYDKILQGGIYDGPLGVVTRDHYLAWKGMQKKKEKKSIWDILDLLMQ